MPAATTTATRTAYTRLAAFLTLQSVITLHGRDDGDPIRAADLLAPDAPTNWPLDDLVLEGAQDGPIDADAVDAYALLTTDGDTYDLHFAATREGIAEILVYELEGEVAWQPVHLLDLDAGTHLIHRLMAAVCSDRPTRLAQATPLGGILAIPCASFLGVFDADMADLIETTTQHLVPSPAVRDGLLLPLPTLARAIEARDARAWATIASLWDEARDEGFTHVACSGEG